MQELPEKQWFPMPQMPLKKRQMKTNVLFARVPLKKKQNTVELSERSGVDTMCEHRLRVTISLNVFWLLPCKKVRHLCFHVLLHGQCWDFLGYRWTTEHTKTTLSNVDDRYGPVQKSVLFALLPLIL